MITSPMLARVLKAAVLRGASDVHAKAGDVFRARVHGELVPLTKQRLTPAQTRALAATFAGMELDDPRLDRLRDFDCSWGISGVGRFRVNVLRQRSSFMVILRVVPFAVPTPENLGLPDVVSRFAELPDGLVLDRRCTRVGEDLDDRGDGPSHQPQPAAPRPDPRRSDRVPAS